ncbi:MAG TPA: MBL fold metallo-hydrolase, partial [Pilimelia sp.]|nr:MBL fold metallo-hydrolase [Pilimelia sp.]
MDGDPAPARVTWWGHSTVWLEDSGVRLLTDPVLTNRVAHLRRRRGPTPRGVSAPDAVLVSHLHADHLHLPSLRRITPSAALVVPAGAAAFLRRAAGAGFADRCVELAAGEHVRIGAVTVHAVPAAHPTGRHHWSRRHATPVGYLVRGAATTWFAGDTGLHDGMAELARADGVAGASSA